MPPARVIDAPQPSEWPFRYPLCPDLPPEPVVVRAHAVDDAFVNAQPSGTQLVTTQRAYLEAEWAAALARHGDATLDAAPGHSESITHPLAIAFRLADPAARLAMCVDALKSGRTAAVAGRDRERLHGSQRSRRRRARPRRGAVAGAGVGSGALRARQAVAARRTTWSRPRTRSSARRICFPGSRRPGPTSAARSASSIGPRRRWPPSSAPSNWTPRVRKP